MNETIEYDDFCEMAGQLAPLWFDELTERARDFVLAVAWEDCAWSRITNERIVRALEEAREKL